MNLKYIYEDLPRGEKALNAQAVAFKLDSGGDEIYGQVSTPACNPGEKFPLLLLCHGYPGLEQNRDIAHAIRCTGFVTAIFHYRGCWGSKGYYGMEHCMEDTELVCRYLMEHCEEYCIETRQVFLLGHSMGGFMVINALARGEVKAQGAILIAPGDMPIIPRKELLMPMKTSMLNLKTPDAHVLELEAHKEQWAFAYAAKKLPDIPYLLIGGEQDTAVPTRQHIDPINEILLSMHYRVERVDLDDNHIFSSTRNSLIRIVAEWLYKRTSTNNANIHGAGLST